MSKLDNVLRSMCFSQMDEFRKEKKHCDVNILIDGISFPCHRVVLASASKFFDKMFDSKFKESEEHVVKMDSVSADCFKQVLDFIYCQQMDINPSNSFELLSASIFFDSKPMEDYCFEYVMKNIPEGHVFETCMFAKLCNKEQLYEKVLEYVAKNFANMCDQNSFLQISCEVLTDIVNHIELQCSHDVILDSIIRWAGGKKVNYREMSNLLSNVNTGDYMAKLICSNGVQRLCISDDKDFTKDDDFKGDSSKEKRKVDSLYESSACCVAQNISRLCLSEMYLEMSYDLIQAIIKHPNLNISVDDYIDLINRWMKNTSVSKDQVEKLVSYALKRTQSKRLSSHCLTELVCNNRDTLCLYVHAITFPNREVVELIYDEGNRKWRKNENYSNQAYHEKNVLMDGRMFTLSVKEKDPNLPLSLDYEFKVKINDTEMRVLKAPKIRVTDRFNLVVSRSTIYLHTITNCFTDKNALTRIYIHESYESKSIFAYTPQLNEWIFVGSIGWYGYTDYNLGACLVSLDDELYIFGTQKLELDPSRANYFCQYNFSPNTSTTNSEFLCNKWKNLIEKPSCTHINGAACAHNGKIYLLGGQSKALEAYDPRAKRWEVLKSAEYDRSYHCLVSYRNKLWAIGPSNDIPIECYNPVTNVWTSTDSLQQALDHNARIADVFVL